MLLLYQNIIAITCWPHLFQITSLFNQFTSLLALNCSCRNFFWNVLQVLMSGKDVYFQMTWSWPDKTQNILCSYCLQWNTSQSVMTGQRHVDPSAVRYLIGRIKQAKVSGQKQESEAGQRRKQYQAEVGVTGTGSEFQGQAVRGQTQR